MIDGWIKARPAQGTESPQTNLISVDKKVRYRSQTYKMLAERRHGSM